MKLPDKYDPILRIGKLLRLGPFGQKQLECGLLHAALYILLFLALDWSRWESWILAAGEIWYSWADFFRFVVFKSTWCHRCRKRKIIKWEMMAKEDLVDGTWMCLRCHKDYSPQARRIEKNREKISGLLGMGWLFKGKTSHTGPLPDWPPEPSDKYDEDPKV